MSAWHAGGDAGRLGLRYGGRVNRGEPTGAERPNVHGVTPEVVVGLLDDVGATPGDARSLLARVFAPWSGDATPRHEKVRRVVREAFASRLDHRGLEVVEVVADPNDGFVKLLLRSPDGALSEAVRIPLEKPGHYTVCLSSQVGCAMACAFCATGRLGLARNLETWEIMAAFIAVRDTLPPGARLTGAVFMGQGEPFHNYDAVLAAAKILSDPSGARIKAENISISTVGLVPEIRRYTAEGHRYRLVVSLTSADNDKRKRLLPVTRKWALPELRDAIAEYVAARGERITLAWVLLGGVNDGRDEVEALRTLFAHIPYKLNLIDVNTAEDVTGRGDGLPWDGDSARQTLGPEGGIGAPPSTFRRSSSAELAAFRDMLRELGRPVVRRYSGGRERHAACGMLASRALERSPDISTIE